MFAITFINYAALHATRSIWSSATKDFKSKFNFSMADVTTMNSTYLICYAVCGIFTGQLADKYQKRKLIPVMYTCVATVMLCLAFLTRIKPENQEKYIHWYYAVKIINGAL